MAGSDYERWRTEQRERLATGSKGTVRKGPNRALHFSIEGDGALCPSSKFHPAGRGSTGSKHQRLADEPEISLRPIEKSIADSSPAG
jgi:hypothetical protein